MKKRIFGRYLSRERDTRRALFRSLTRALVINGKIRTTRAKAKAIQADIDKMVTLAKKGDVASKRSLYSLLANDRSIAEHVLKKILPVFSNKKSGFTRITNLPRRVGDNAQIVRLEWSSEVSKYETFVKGKNKEKPRSKADKKETEEKGKRGLFKKKKISK
jgi:large subunit ribosomal protein L17